MVIVVKKSLLTHRELANCDMKPVVKKNGSSGTVSGYENHRGDYRENESQTTEHGNNGEAILSTLSVAADDTKREDRSDVMNK